MLDSAKPHRLVGVAFEAEEEEVGDHETQEQREEDPERMGPNQAANWAPNQGAFSVGIHET